MRSHLAIGALGVLAMGVVPVAAKPQTTPSGSTPPASDICAFVQNELKVTLPGLPGKVAVGFISVCACVSTIPAILRTNVVAIAAVTIAGTAAVTTSLEDMIESVGSTCQYPEGAIPVCESNNPCGYMCGNGFSVSTLARQCVCESPNAVCNGQCASSCPSAVVIVPERRAASASDRVANRRRMCPRGFTPCGIFEQRGQVGEPWDCVDTRHELESCGGCMTPFDSLSPRGVDCTAIPGVADVSCMRGSCVVRRCTSGYAVTADRSQCVPTR